MSAQPVDLKSATAASNRRNLAQAIQGVAAMDSFQNVLARTGFGMPNLLEGTRYPLTRFTRDYNTLNALYRNSWLVRRIIDCIPKDMLKNWVKYTSDIEPEKIDQIHKMERVTKLQQSLLDGLKWGRLYGGAGGLIMIEGQEDILDEPLDVETILPGDFKGVLVVDRWSGIFPQLELVDDVSDPEFGLPKYYQFTDYPQQNVFRVHHSRIIRFVGDDLPFWEKQAETYWGASKIEAIIEDLKKRDNVSQNIAGIVFRANLNVLKMSDMGELLTGTNVKAQADFYTTLQAQNWLMNNFGMFLMSKEDDFQNVTNKFEGLDDIYETFMLDLSGATQIPMTKLFGRSPAGMNSTGESDMQNYYDVIEQEQESNLRPALEKLLPVIAMSTLGEIPDDMDFMFNPVKTSSDKEAADLLKAKSEILFGAHDRGLVTDQIGMKELKELAEETGMFTNITDEDIEKASNEIVKPEMGMIDPETGEPLKGPQEDGSPSSTESNSDRVRTANGGGTGDGGQPASGSTERNSDD